MHHPQRLIQRSTHSSRAFTLVEMLVATTVTLLLIFAITQAFATVSVTVRNSRANVEMAGQLRSTSLRLQQDLEGLTAEVTPWVHSSWGRGYFEYYDGPSNDIDSNANGTIDFAEDTNASTTTTDVQDGKLDSSLGDIDDILMFTTRSDADPFGGRWVTGGTASMIQSSVAEVAWWLRPGQANKYMLYRRALLIRPDLNTLVTSTAPFPPEKQSLQYAALLSNSPKGYYDVSSGSPDITQMQNDVIAFLNNYDLSVHFDRVHLNNNPNQVVLCAVANSLNNLTLRHNRFCHDPVVLNGTYIRYPANPINQTPASQSGVFPNPIFQVSAAALSLPNVVQSGLSQGEDVMLANMLAFDVRAFDPLCIVVATKGPDSQWGVAGFDDNSVGGPDDHGEAGWVNSDDEAAIPGDPNFALDSIVNATYPLPHGPPSGAVKIDNIIGMGAFVDLNYFGKYPSSAWPANFASSTYFDSTPHFGAVPHTKSLLSFSTSGTYDTWPFDYESDGINQDNDSGGSGSYAYVDEGTNGLDDTGHPDPNPPNADPNGRVDDEPERETSPPYVNPLKSIQIRLRIIDPDTRQVRQTGVITYFSK